MDNKERFLCAIKLGKPDAVPYCDYFNPESVLNICRCLDITDQIGFDKIDTEFTANSFEVADLLIAMTRVLDIDALNAISMPGVKEVPGDEKLIQDSFGTIYRKSTLEPIPIKGALRDENDLSRLSKVRPEHNDFRLLEYLKRNAPERIVIYYVEDSFKMSWRLLGALEKLMLLYVENPSFVRKLASMTTEFLKVEITMAIEKGADVIIQDGDWAERKKPFISPKMFREFVKPRCLELVETAHHYGIPIIKHSDGNVSPLLEDIVEVGYDGINPIEPQAMDIIETKERLRGKISIMGNIDCMHLLPFGKVEEIEEVVKKTLKIAALDGGYICSSSNSIHPGVPAVNAIAMIKAIKQYGEYPIQID